MKIYDIKPPTNKAEKPLYKYSTRAEYIKAVKRYNEANRIIDLREPNLKNGYLAQYEDFVAWKPKIKVRDIN